MNQFLWGALAMAALTCALYFLRFWRETRDRLFAFFALAFAMLGLNWVGLMVVDAPEERHKVLLLRLLAFLLIIGAIIDRNRRALRAKG
jgi:hypothetical protein